MMDFNFFEPYIKVTTKPVSKNLLYPVLLALIIVLFIAYHVFLTFKVNNLNAQIEEIRVFIESSDTQTKIIRIQDKQNKEAALQQAILDLQLVSDTISKTDLIDVTLVENITAFAPDNVFLSELSINLETISIKGYATEYNAIAQFASNLRDIEGVSNTLIPTVNEDNGNFGYTITVEFVKEAQDENQ